MTRALFSGLLLALAIASGCDCAGRHEDVDAGHDAGGGIDASTEDAGAADGGVDSGTSDAGGSDAGASDAGGSDAGADGGADGGADSGIDGSTGSCDPNLGAMCSGEVCPSGLECTLGRCVPQSRPICGGFAGAPCTDPTYSYCLYFASADFGTCVTPAETACLCARAPGSFTSCP